MKILHANTGCFRLPHRAKAGELIHPLSAVVLNPKMEILPPVGRYITRVAFHCGKMLAGMSRQVQHRKREKRGL